jgi:CheY-like chemotaxis protein
MSLLSHKRVAATSNESPGTRVVVTPAGSDQARLDRDRELAIPSDYVNAAVLRQRQRDLDRINRPELTVEDETRRSSSASQRDDGRRAGTSPATARRPTRVEQPANPEASIVDRRPRLIIADDDPVIVAMLEGSMSGKFDVVGSAADGEEAIELARANQPDAAVIDVEMPKGGGLTAVKGIVEVAPDTAIVVLSSDESDSVVRELMEAGAMAYRRKGLAPEVLADSLTESIKVHAVDREVSQARPC